MRAYCARACGKVPSLIEALSGGVCLFGYGSVLAIATAVGSKRLHADAAGPVDGRCWIGCEEAEARAQVQQVLPLRRARLSLRLVASRNLAFYYCCQAKREELSLQCAQNCEI